MHSTLLSLSTRRATACALAGALLTGLAIGAQAAPPAPMGHMAQKGPAKAAAKTKGEAPLPEATPEQLSAAELVKFGDYACEFKQTVKVALNPKYPGYADVVFGKLRWTMKPVLSSTGAVRLEDVKGQTLMLQIAHKSMVMDVKAGRRVVDECQHETQAAAKRAYEAKAAEEKAAAAAAQAASASAAPAASQPAN